MLIITEINQETIDSGHGIAALSIVLQQNPARIWLGQIRRIRFVFGRVLHVRFAVRRVFHVQFAVGRAHLTPSCTFHITL